MKHVLEGVAKLRFSRFSELFKPIFRSFLRGNINNRISPPIKEQKSGQKSSKNRRTLSFAIPSLYFLRAASTCFGNTEPFAEEPKEKRWFNPISDPCWNCFFPIHIGGWNLSSQKDFVKYDPWQKKLISLIPLQGIYGPACSCGLTHFGVRLAFWETQSVIEVTRIPYQFATLGGLSLGQARGWEKFGTASASDTGGSSFYNVHHYPFPIFRILAAVPGFDCFRKLDISIPLFMSEWAPFWNEPDWQRVLDPERFLFASPEWQSLCRKDCKASSERKPTDSYPWCAGCLGSLYPYSGHVPHHIGGIQASSLIVCRWLAAIHSAGKFLKQWNLLGLGMGFEKDNYCEKTYFPELRKTIYKTQLIHPKSDVEGEEKDGRRVYCHPLGESDRVWASEGFTYPDGGEDFAYLVWTKTHCCFNVVDLFFRSISSMEKQGMIRPEQAEAMKDFRETLEGMQKAAELGKQWYENGGGS